MADGQPPLWFEYVKVWAAVLTPIVTWGLVIGGWLFVRKDNNDREDRRELRATINSIIDDIRELEEKAFEYYTSDPTMPETSYLAVRLKRGQVALEGRIHMLKKATGRFGDFSKAHAFKDHLTSGDFEVSSRKLFPPTDSKHNETALAAKELIEYLEEEYNSLIPKKK